MIGTVGGRAGPITSATNKRAFGGHNDVRRRISPRRVTRWCPGRGGVLARNLPGIRRRPAVRVAIGADASADLSVRKPGMPARGHHRRERGVAGYPPSRHCDGLRVPLVLW